MEPVIRQATESDIEVIKCLVNDAYRHYIPRIGKAPGPMSDDYDLLVQKGYVWVLVLEEEMMGLLVLVPTPEHMLLDNVAVSPARQRSGLGRRLISFAEERARQHGYREIVLYTNQAMHENIKLYTRLGYEEFSRGIEHSFHRVYMKKRF